MKQNHCLFDPCFLPHRLSPSLSPSARLHYTQSHPLSLFLSLCVILVAATGHFPTFWAPALPALRLLLLAIMRGSLALLAIACVSFAAAGAHAAGLGLQLNSDGSYTVNVNGNTWLSSGAKPDSFSLPLSPSLPSHTSLFLRYCASRLTLASERRCFTVSRRSSPLLRCKPRSLLFSLCCFRALLCALFFTVSPPPCPQH